MTSVVVPGHDHLRHGDQLLKEVSRVALDEARPVAEILGLPGVAHEKQLVERQHSTVQNIRDLGHGLRGEIRGSPRSNVDVCQIDSLHRLFGRGNPPPLGGGRSARLQVLKARNLQSDGTALCVSRLPSPNECKLTRSPIVPPT